MANTFDDVKVQTFANTLRALAQQGEEKLRSWCQVEYKQSESHNFDRIGLVEATSKATRAADSPINETPFSRRQSVVTTLHAGDLVEPEDAAQALVDPNSGIATAIAKGMRRAVDAKIITAATSASRNGDGGAVNFVAGQILGDHTAEISFDFVSQVFELFAGNELIDEDKCFVIGPKQLRKLQGMVEYTSSDYVNLKALAEKGYTPNWLGFTWILHNGLGASGGAGTIDCFAMTRRAIGLHVAKDIWAEAAVRADKSMAVQIYAAMTMGAVRVEDEQLVWAKLADTVT